MLTDDVAVAGQIGPQDVAQVSGDGFKSLVCNRPDGEAADQPAFAEIEAAARECGLATCYFPIDHTPMCASDVDAFAKAMADLPKPVLAYCRSGARSAKIVLAWQAREEGDL